MTAILLMQLSGIVPSCNYLFSPSAENPMLASVKLFFFYFLSPVIKLPIFVFLKELHFCYFPSPAFFRFKVVDQIISFSY